MAHSFRTKKTLIRKKGSGRVTKKATSKVKKEIKRRFNHKRGVHKERLLLRSE